MQRVVQEEAAEPKGVGRLSVGVGPILPGGPANPCVKPVLNGPTSRSSYAVGSMSPPPSHCPKVNALFCMDSMPWILSNIDNDARPPPNSYSRLTRVLSLSTAMLDGSSKSSMVPLFGTSAVSSSLAAV
ncbi:hypothetical protein HPB49_005872 [Dermacentor silvarum]|uniref:Uncharacterized protein n=1 Tax=Dermacentor silvarum TaxID=543639 RepID=A0ACB8DW34_DERSI|nr:hypothetical protein HPB49_005872 [Dermacentor silvarum]